MASKKVLIAGVLACAVCLLAAVPGMNAWAQEEGAKAVNVILKNDSDSSVDVACIDQYGGNFTATVEGSTSQNQTLMAQSEIKIGENVIHVVTPADEGQELLIAAP